MYIITLTAKHGGHIMVCRASGYSFSDDYLIIHREDGGTVTISCAYWDFEILEMD